MIRHIVMWHMKDEVGGVSKEENVADMKAQLEALTESIPEIRELEVGINIKDSDAASDIVLVTSFESPADLATYQAHPEHQKVAHFIQDVTGHRCVVDYEI